MGQGLTPEELISLTGYIVSVGEWIKDRTKKLS